MRIARRQADDYDELLMQQSEEACDCHDCQSSIKLGIQVFDWIIGADRSYRKALYAGRANYDQLMEVALAELLRRWYAKCDGVLKWAKYHEKLGFEVARLAEFKQRCEEARAMVRSLDESKGDRIMREPLIILRDKALDDHLNGQTAEFV